MAEITFFLLAVSTCAFALLAVVSRDVFHCAVWLALTLLNVSLIYFYLDAHFLGVVQVLVYVGGIITLFVFAIKLTAKIGDKSIRQVNEQVIISAIISLAFLYILIYITQMFPWAAGQPGAASLSLNILGQSLVTLYALPFEFISIILLAALVGAIVIGKVKK